MFCDSSSTIPIHMMTCVHFTEIQTDTQEMTERLLQFGRSIDSTTESKVNHYFIRRIGMKSVESP